MNSLWMRAIAALPMTLALPAWAQTPPQLLHPMFQDHGVLQRDRPIAVWGDARPGEQVRVTLAGRTAHARADKQGHWRVQLPALPAGGPHALEVSASGGARQSVSDLLVGDVWLCSGQSNMEMGVASVLSGQMEVATANDSQIRLMSIDHKTSIDPQRQFPSPVSWQLLSPQTVGDFSAACYFMARDLRTTEKVPMGLIDSSWGGTAIEAWRGEAALLKDPQAQDALALLRAYRTDQAAASRTYGERWLRWYSEGARDPAGSEPWQPGSAGDWRPLPSFEPWESWGVAELAEWNGIVWYRTEVTLTAEQAAKGATLALSPADDIDVSFVNGIPVGTTFAWGEQRAYRLASGTLRAGRNQIAVAINDSWANGGLIGPDAQRAIRFEDGSSVPLPPAAGWQYRIGPKGLSDAPHAPWEAIAGYSGIYNAMIAPLGSYGLRGVAWYQGESNAGRAAGYSDQLLSMMAAWRDQFGRPDLPFLIIQLAGWGPLVTQPVENGTAQIRDEQRRAAAADPHAALIVAQDLGDVKDIHPANKQEVGARMARAARVLAYGAKLGTGPRPLEASRTPDGVRLRFGGVAGSLVALSGRRPIAFELCGTAPASCRFVDARLSGQEVLIEAGSGLADRVRFCWGGSPICNLTDESGLPAPAFELPVR